MISKEQIAHDLAIVYLINRYGAEVVGRFDVSGDRESVSGYGNVGTLRMPDVDEERIIKVKTGNKKGFGPFMYNEKVKVADGYKVDRIFTEMIQDYKDAYTKIIELLSE